MKQEQEEEETEAALQTRLQHRWRGGQSMQGAEPEASYLQHGSRIHPEDMAGHKRLTVQIQGPLRRQDDVEGHLHQCSNKS